MKSWFPLLLLSGSLSTGFLLSTSDALGQVVQLPTVGSFNLSTSVAVPDSGTMSVGGNTSGRMGSATRGPIGGRSVTGKSLGGGSASLHTTIIDLEELDAMIRSQAGRSPSQPKLHVTDPPELVRIAAAPKGRIETPEYEYLAVLSGHGQILEKDDPDAVNYYLGLAERAKNRRNWASVEIYYRLAWDHLPLARREAALQELAKARAKAKVSPSGATVSPNRR